MTMAHSGKPPSPGIPKEVLKKEDYYEKLRPGTVIPSSILPPSRETDDLITIKKVVNGWVVTIAPHNVPVEYVGGNVETLVFNRLSDLFDALKIFYGED